MRGLIQRVSSAEVRVDHKVVGAIEAGLLLFLGIEPDDTNAGVEKLVNKVLNYRVFSDEQGHMNCSLLDVGGSLLVVSQFTLAADTRKGLRPSFSSAAPPELANRLYEEFIASAGDRVKVEQGVFGADMKVALTNDGPVTFLLSA